MNPKDCGFSDKSGWFRYRAAAIIIEDGNVLVAKNDFDPYYYSVGGAVRLHETAEDAVLREAFEETGVRYEIERLAFIHENFFIGTMGYKEQKYHEVAFYFLMKPNGVKIFNHTSYVLNGVPERVHWLPINRLHEYTVYPAFYGEKLLNLSDKAEHIVTHE